MKKFIWFIIILALGWILYIAFQSPTNGDVLKIGVIAPLTGDAAAYGEQMQRILDYRVAQINAKGDGPTFSLVYEDGKCTGSDSVLGFQKLVDIDGVDLIIGGGCSSETLAIAPLVKDKAIVLLSSLSSNPVIEEENDNVFSLSYSDEKTGQDLAKAVSGFSKVALITEQNDYNIGIRDSVLKGLTAYPGVTIVSNETFPKGATDFRSVLEKVAKTKPEAVILNPNIGTTAENLIKQVAQMKAWTGNQLFSQIAYTSDNSRKDVGSFADGMTIIDSPTIANEDFVTLSADIEKTKGTLADLGNYYTASTLDALDILTSLVQIHGDDPVAIQQALATESFTGFIGPIFFGGNNFVQLEISGRYVVENGTAVLQ